MLINDITLVKKSIMYKIISLGFPTYIGDNSDEFLITALICSNCGKLWSMSRTECMFCGTENPHIYKCRKCKQMYSITRTNKKCCGRDLVKICINENCITNTNEVIRDFFDAKGGVFETNKSGATLNEMRCKHCGNKENEYKSLLLKLVNNFDDADFDICSMKKNSESNFEVKYRGKHYIFSSIEAFIKKLFVQNY